MIAGEALTTANWLVILIGVGGPCAGFAIWAEIDRRRRRRRDGAIGERYRQARTPDGDASRLRRPW